MSDPAQELPTPTEPSPHPSDTDTSDSDTRIQEESETGTSTQEEATECDEEKEIPQFHQQVVFLKTVDCPYTPNSVDFILLDSESVLVIISEVTNCYFCSHLIPNLDDLV